MTLKNIILTYNGGGNVSFNASGFSGVHENGGFRITRNFTMDITSGGDFQWNRLSLLYSSSEPLKILLTYTEESEEITDEFFLEAGEKMMFHALNRGYLLSRRASSVRRISVSALSGDDTEFSLLSVSGEVIPVVVGDTHYIENDTYKLGVKLVWGGGISYIADKNNPADGLGNLINNHDTGRLIQQSYYGVRENDIYKPGKFMDNVWCYNPVQGGDQFNNKSRLIDLEVTEDSIYVKAQPQDWALNGALTPSYMENRYTLTDDIIRVDNRFIDFSGWKHPYSHQELPAFYTVSFLDTFIRYDGENPWSCEPVSRRNDLNFWGDPEYAAESNFALREGNSETWCAWINEEIDYGIGLYVPNVDILKAGRYKFNGSKDPGNDACNYVAPLNQIRISSYSPIEYSYLIKTGSLSAIRTCFYKNKDFADNAALHTDYISMKLPR